MSVDKIKEQIFLEVEQKVNEILREADEEKEGVLSEAEKDIERINLDVVERGKSSIEIEHKRQIAKVRLEAKMNTLNAKEKGIKEAVNLGLEKLSDFFNSDASTSTLQKLVIDGGVALEGGEIQVLVRKDDTSKIKKEAIEKAVTEKTGKRTTIQIEVVDKTTKIGGAVIKKGEILVDNTVESILDRKLREIRLKVANLLLE
ncbi:MAG: V-type ATP synthase subunit E [Candidatus Hodarchaeales archaeon]|jgi:V/A-type H+-transporting ATPase subunit E